MDVKVDRKTWYRGNGSANSKLLSADGRCCLGFAAAQCGIDDGTLMNADTPARLVRRCAEVGSKLPKDFLVSGNDHMFAANSEWIGDAMNINDDQAIGDTLRETKLIALFAENGHTISFEG